MRLATSAERHDRPVAGLVVSVAMHALVLTGLFTHLGAQRDRPGPTDLRTPAQAATVLYIQPPAAAPDLPAAAAPAEPTHTAATPPPIQVPDLPPVVDPITPHQPAMQAAPPAPTAADWAFASTYTLKNSKGYRYTWGQQVRSMMGTAVEGPEQGMVRFRVEIAPDGHLARLDTLWSTSATAERLARQAVASMPKWPATPTGQPLVFERTIAFSPSATGGPPLYRHDCEPDRPAARNPFAWDGRATAEPTRATPPDPPDAQALEDCLRQLPRDSIDAESARDQRVMDRWGWSASKPGR